MDKKDHERFEKLRSLQNDIADSHIRNLIEKECNSRMNEILLIILVLGIYLAIILGILIWHNI